MDTLKLNAAAFGKLWELARTLPHEDQLRLTGLQTGLLCMVLFRGRMQVVRVGAERNTPLFELDTARPFAERQGALELFLSQWEAWVPRDRRWTTFTLEFLTNLREDDVLEASDIHPYSLELSRFAFPENPKLGELLTLGQRLVADGCQRGRPLQNLEITGSVNGVFCRFHEDNLSMVRRLRSDKTLILINFRADRLNPASIERSMKAWMNAKPDEFEPQQDVLYFLEHLDNIRPPTPQRERRERRTTR